MRFNLQENLFEHRAIVMLLDLDLKAVQKVQHIRNRKPGLSYPVDSGVNTVAGRVQEIRTLQIGIVKCGIPEFRV